MAKIRLELVTNMDGIGFLNFWSKIAGDYVCCKIENGKLIDYKGDDEEISLAEFVGRVERAVIKEKLDKRSSDEKSNQGP